MIGDWIQALHFLRPQWFFALVPVILGLILVLRRQSTSMSWKAVCDDALLPHVLTRPEGSRNRWPAWLTAFIATLGIIALAGPVWEKLPQPVFRDDSAVVIALDLSRSMDATDIKPTRLSRARLKALDILDQRGSGQTALLVYAAEAFVVSPLTDDTDTIAHLVPTLETDIMPAQGSDTTAALNKAQQLLQQAGIQDGHIILLTDGISGSHLDQIDASMTANHRLSVIGIGTSEGSPIPMTGGFLTDRNGGIVIPVLERESLRKAAAAGGGMYRDMQNDDRDIEQILALNTADVDLQQDEQDITADSWREEGPWLLLLVVPLAALFARRGLLGILAVLILPMQQDAHAFEFEDLWKTPDQRGMQAFDAGDTATAAREFEDPRWRSSAHYRQGEYRKALESAGEPASSDDYYNRANALAKLGELEQALDAYDKALELDPDNEDADWNRKLVEDAVEQRERQDEQQQKQQADNDQQQQADTEQGEDSQQQNSTEQQQKGDASQEENKANNEQQADQPQQGETDNNMEGAQQDASALEQQGQQQLEQAPHAREQQDANKQASNIEEIRQGETDEQARATEQWLQRIPDDPGGLLRRKFQYQYKQRGNAQHEQQPW